MLQALAEAVDLKPTIWTTLILLLGAFLWTRFGDIKNKKLNVPEIPSHGLQDNRQALQDGFNTYSKANQPYYLKMPHHDILVLPPELMFELKSAPESDVSFIKEVYDRFNGRWTTLGKAGNDVVPVVRGDITRHIGRLLTQMFIESEWAFPQEIGEPSEWTAMPVYMKIVRIVALLTGRTFIGLPTSRDENWLRVIIFHTRQIFACSEDLWRYPRWARNIVAPFTKGVRDLHANLKITKDMVRPKVQERMELIKRLPPGAKPPDDTLQWIIDDAPPGLHDDIEHHAMQQLGLSVAAIHTTGMNITHNLYDLAAHPQYQSILRSEILSTFKAKDGVAVIAKQDITKLRKLDSFMKESQRVNPPSLLSMNRKILCPQGMTLSTGFHLPQGTFIATPSAQIAMDESVFENAKEFDGLRFYNLRKMKGNENKYQFVTTSLESMVFGHGLHACPGRFFASNEIKIFLMYVLLNYDLKLDNEENGRPKNVVRGISLTPDPMAKLCWKKRKAEMKMVGEEADS